jgi:hypothetical protein
LYSFFSKVTFNSEVSISQRISSQTIDLAVLRRHIQEFFTFIEFISLYEKQFQDHILKIGSTVELVRQLYIFYRPYFTLAISRGPSSIFNQEPSAFAIEEKILDRAFDIDQISDISRVGMYELSAPYIIGHIAD